MTNRVPAGRRRGRRRPGPRAATADEVGLEPVADTPGRRRVAVTGRLRTFMIAAGIAPLLLAGIGAPVILLVSDALDASSAMPLLVLAAAIQVTVVVAVLAHDWLPHVVDLRQPDGRAFERGGDEIIVLAMPGGLGVASLLVLFLGYGYVPSWSVLLSFTGSLIVVVPTMLQRAVERRRAARSRRNAS